MKKVIAGVAAGLMSLSLVALGSSAALALPVTTSWTDAGLQQMFSVNGHVTWSADGLGIARGETGTLQVQRAASSSVIAAYLLVSSNNVTSAPTDIMLNDAPVTLTHSATETTSGYSFTNYFGDVTSNIKALIDNSAAGVIDVAVDNGANQTSDPEFITGDALVVVFNTPSAPSASIVLDFGTSATAGDTFTIAYPALTEPETADLEMSIGDAYSYGRTQTSTITVNGETLTDQAGHFDDCSTFVDNNNRCPNPALITVGGVGDTLANPTVGDTWTPTNDDELYSLSPFVNVGDTDIVVNTNNASNDDNIFMALFYLKDIVVTGSEPVSSLGEITEPIAEPSAPTLANTGMNANSLLGTSLAAGAVLLTGLGVALNRRRRTAK